jgi:hypothetical protein
MLATDSAAKFSTGCHLYPPYKNPQWGGTERDLVRNWLNLNIFRQSAWRPYDRCYRGSFGQLDANEMLRILSLDRSMEHELALYSDGVTSGYWLDKHARAQSIETLSQKIHRLDS